MKSRQAKNSCLFDFAALAVAIGIGFTLFFGLPKHLRYRWYNLEGTFRDIPAISADTEFEAYSTEELTVKVTVRNNSNTSYQYMDHLTHAEYLRDGQWMYWGETPIEKRAHTLVYHEIPPKATAVCEISLGAWLPTPLEPGSYRIWLAYAPADAPPEGTGQVCAYFSVAEA